MPFTPQQFCSVFREYNEAVWSAQVFLVGLALAAVTLVLAFFTRINPLAYVFALVAQAAFLLNVAPDLGLIAAAAVGIALLATAHHPSTVRTS